MDEGLFSSVKTLVVKVIDPCDCLTSVETYVVLAALSLVARYVLDLFRSRSNNRFFVVLLFILDGVPYIFLDYTLGLMQLAQYRNDLYQVWAVVLVTLRYSISATRPSGIFREQKPLKEMMSSFWTANLLGTHTHVLKIPLWLLWSLNSVRFILGFHESESAYSKRKRNVKLIAEYMRHEHEIRPTDYRVENMWGYKYLVWGEDKQRVETHAPEYRVQLTVTDERMLFTTQKIWEQIGMVVRNTDSNKLKDLCLSFALFKLLARRFVDLPLYEAPLQKTKEFVLSGLLQNNSYDRAFRIIEVELSFLTDSYYTRFGVVFSKGFPILRLILSILVIGVASSLLHLFSSSYENLKGDLANNPHGVSITLILIVTWILIISLILKEFWEMVTYVLSDWTKVVLICNYVQKNYWWMRCPATQIIVRLLCKMKVSRRWHGFLWQHNLIQSYTKSTVLINLIFWASCSKIINKIVSRRHPGAKLNNRVKVPNEVKLAISESVRYLLNTNTCLNSYLLNAANSANFNLETKVQITSASNLVSEARKILVWHIATCYCEIGLSSHAAGNTARFASLESPFFLQNLDDMEQGLESHYKAATALSQYCCHLLTLSTPLVPDHKLVTKELFTSTQRNIQRCLKGCLSWDDVIKALNDITNKEDDDDNEEEEHGKRILKMSVRLGRELTEAMCNGTALWLFLEKFWAGYLLYLASSVDADDHKDALGHGGEFLTHVWALLSHAGILK